ncbi:MAG: sensor histidine kinase [Calditrichaeota bacterium]|nr:MAG: sensor histidine kinase [Calditrichota bacterium]
MRRWIDTFHHSFSIRTKLLVSIILLITVIFITVSAVVLSANRNDFLHQIRATQRETTGSLRDDFLEPLLVQDLQYLMNRIHSLVGHSIASIEVYDPHFRVIASSAIERLGEIDQELAQETPILPRAARDSLPRIYLLEEGVYLAPLEIQGELLGLLRVEFDREKVAENIRANMLHVGQKLLLLFAIVFVIGVAGAILVANRLTRPIQHLRNELQQLEEEVQPDGEPAFAGTSNPADEIEQLHQGFRRMAHSLRNYLRELEQLTEEKQMMHTMAALGEVAMKVAHEIRNALYSIRGATGYLRKTVKNALVAEYTGVIEDSVTNLNNMVTSLLEYARPIEVQLTPCELQPLICKSVELLKPDLAEKGIRLSLNLPEGVQVLADPPQINQVLLNLLLNAVDAVSGEGQITISARQEGAQVIIEVADNGVGMSPEQVEKAFKPFYTDKPGGTGLGLAVAQKIVQRHHGKITITSHPGEGTRVAFSLPVAPDNALKTEHRLQSRPEPCAPSSS